MQNAVACGAHWTDFITFRYDLERRSWLFDNEIVTFSDPLNGTPDNIKMTHASRANPVSFETWRRMH